MRIRKRESGHVIADMFVFLLLGVFALLSLSLVLFCAQAYRGTVERSQIHNDARVLGAYVRNSIRAEDASGAIGLMEADGLTVLTVLPADDEGEYIRYIYVYEGALRELYTSVEREFAPEEGETLCEAASMTASREGKLICVTLTGADGTEYRTTAALRSEA